MAYILTPRFAQVHQAPQCNPFGFCAPSSQPTYGFRTAQRSQPQPQLSPFANFFSQLEELVSEIDRESQHEAQIEAQREALREAQRAAHIKAEREAYQAHVEAQRAAYRQRQAEIEAHIAAQREAHRQRQLRSAFRAQFVVTQNEQGWQVDAEVPGFEQDNISIEFADDNTLKISGNTEWGAKSQDEAQTEAQATPAIEQSTENASKHTGEQTTEESVEEKMEGITLEAAADLEPTAESATDITETESVRPGTPDSDTSSHRSYQPTVEDDFEDLGPEASTLFSTSSAPATPSEPKGKEKAVEPAADPEISIPTETAVVQEPQFELSTQQQQQQQQETDARFHGSFERTYRFPERIDASNVRASLKEGVLSITVPRAQTQQVRKIAIF